MPLSFFVILPFLHLPEASHTPSHAYGVTLLREDSWLALAFSFNLQFSINILQTTHMLLITIILFCSHFILSQKVNDPYDYTLIPLEHASNININGIAKYTHFILFFPLKSLAILEIAIIV